MAQGGSLKGPKKNKKSSVSSRGSRKSHRENKKGNVSRTVRSNKKTIAASEIKATTKAINKKNETWVAAKAVSGGDRFFANDISEKGKEENKNQRKKLVKKETKAMKLGDKLKKKLGSMGREL